MDTDDRLVDPLQIPRSHALHQRGGLDLASLDRRLTLIERYDDRTPLVGMAIGFQMPNQGADQTMTSTSFTQVTGSVFELSFLGADDAIWLAQMTYRVVISSSGAVDTDVWARLRIDWGDGAFRDPDIDLSTVHGDVTAFGPVDYAESAATGVGFSLKPGAVLKVGGGSTIRVGLYVAVGAGQSAVVQANTTLLNPHCFGTAVPYRRPR